MHPLRITHFTSSLALGGAEAVLFDLVRCGIAAGYEQQIISLHDGPYRARYEALGISVICIRGLFHYADPLGLYRASSTIKAFAPDCIHTQLWAANCMGRILALHLNIPLIMVLHNQLAHTGKIRAFVDLCTQVGTPTVVGVTQEIACAYATRYNVPAPSLATITNGITLPTIYKKEPTDRHIIIGAVGRFVPVKNYHLLLDVVASLVDEFPNIQLMLIGYGPLEAALRTHAQQLGITNYVQFIIAQPAQAYYPFFDLFVQPSDSEGMSIALLEAMSYALPSIVTTQNTHPVITHHENGICIPPRDHAALQMALRYYITHREQARLHGERARNTIEQQYCVEKMFAQYEKLFYSVQR